MLTCGNHPAQRAAGASSACAETPGIHNETISVKKKQAGIRRTWMKITERKTAAAAKKNPFFEVERDTGKTSSAVYCDSSKNVGRTSEKPTFASTQPQYLNECISSSFLSWFCPRAAGRRRLRGIFTARRPDVPDRTKR